MSLVRLVIVASMLGWAQSAGAQTAPTYFSADMEGSVTGWSTVGTWAVTSETAHSGSKSWSDSPGGNYPPGHFVLETPPINLTSAVNPRLTFWHTYFLVPIIDDILLADYLDVAVIKDNGESVFLKRYYSAQFVWTLEQFDLTPFAGNQSLRIAFHLVGFNRFPMTHDGWHIDDVVVSEGPGPGLGAFAKLTPTDGTIGLPPDVTLSWTASAGAAGYEYCYTQCWANWQSTTATSATLTGLSAGHYVWQVRAVNANASDAREADGGSLWSFSTGPLPPTVVTGTANGITAHGATLHGTVDPNGLPTTGHFLYHLTPSTDNSVTPLQAVGSGNMAVPISATLTGLVCDRLYTFLALAHTALWNPTGSWVPFTTAACPRVDLNGDGFADVLWRNSVTGENIGWLMNGLTVASSAFLPALTDTNWEIAGVGDLDDDGNADIIWRDRATGEDIQWLMNGLAVAITAYLPTMTTDWAIAGVGDFDGTRYSDIILRNKVTGENIGWLRYGVNGDPPVFLPTIADTNWEIVGIGDLDGDRKADVLWRNKVTGQNVGWLMTGLTVRSPAFLPTIADTNWRIVGVGDLNGDGKADVLLRNSANGQNVGWVMDGLTVASSAFLPTIADTNWEIKAVRDMDGDVKTDVILRNAATGQNVAWLMNGLTVVNAAFLPTIADTNWQIVGK